MNVKLLVVAVPTAIIATAIVWIANFGLSKKAVDRIANLFPKSRK